MSKNQAGSAISSQMLYNLQCNKDKPAGPVIVAIDLQTPANIGAVYRLADATAAKKIIFVTDNDSDFRNNKVVKSTSRNTSSTIDTELWSHHQFHNNHHRLPELIAIELTTKATNVFTTDLPSNCSFVIGSERHGIPDTVLNDCKSAVNIPMLGTNGSMNVSHALALCLYEWHRQHTFTDTQQEKN